ncbi:restriction system protein [Terracoccus luteus]|uniref:Restriction system protein n=1 Tax=Terracoccus luteus TaxID=53356 RepID=A0A495Y1X3_9MICO|nr:restriction endonuclease [Terracoccus luteus]RKT79214.1 restriction system protein [Terracoccus luteus]
MTVPDYQTMMRPVLETLEALGPQQFRDLVVLVADRLSLTEEDRSEMIDSGQPVLSNRAGWAVTYLVQAGAVRRPKRAVAEITDRGRALVASVDGPIGNAHLAEFEEFQAFKRRTRPSKAAATPPSAGWTESESDLSPREVIEVASKSHRAAVTGDLLDRVMELSPAAYERLVLDLLGAMGYGTAGAIESTAKSGDAGIDGVISQDPLGLDRIYVQAKRYARDRTVGRPLMQEFVGALHGQQADRGVFMATCPFTREALDYAERVGARIIPIDGDRLGELLLKYAVGVQPDFTAVLHRVDDDFFETLEERV